MAAPWDHAAADPTPTPTPTPTPNPNVVTPWRPPGTTLPPAGVGKHLVELRLHGQTKGGGTRRAHGGGSLGHPRRWLGAQRARPSGPASRLPPWACRAARSRGGPPEAQPAELSALPRGSSVSPGLGNDRAAVRRCPPGSGLRRNQSPGSRRRQTGCHRHRSRRQPGRRRPRGRTRRTSASAQHQTEPGQG